MVESSLIAFEAVLGHLGVVQVEETGMHWQIVPQE